MAAITSADRDFPTVDACFGGGGVGCGLARKSGLKKLKAQFEYVATIELSIIVPECDAK
ncbi:MAG: hypothetical protein ABSB42_07300 [Tepidisphaeraceae bacterium]|jgi:hypothetical protein